MKSLMVRGAVGLGAALTLTLPAASLAATPQQIIDKGLNDITFTQPSAVSGEIRVNLSERRVNMRTPDSTANITLTVNERKVPKSGQAVPDSAGTLRVTQVVGTGAYAMPTLSNPGTIEWKIINSVGYVRVGELSDAVRLFLQSKGVDPAAAVGTWVKIDAQEICAAAGDVCAMGINTAISNASTAQSIVTQSPILVTRTERRWSSANGDKMVRVRAKINPTVITNLQNAETAKIAKNDPQRAAKLAEIRTRFAEARKQASAIQLALNVNTTKSSVERVEVGMTQTEPEKTCTTNAKTKKSVCRTTGFKSVTTLVGLNVSGASADPVTAPESSISAVSLVTSVLQSLPGISL